MCEARREGILKLQLFETFLSFCVRFCWIILALQRYVFLLFFFLLFQGVRGPPGPPGRPGAQGAVVSS